MTVHARVFTKDDNRFLVPGYWYSDEDPGMGFDSPTACLCESLMWSVVCGAKEDGWLDLDADENGIGTITHIPYRLVSHGFAHGSVPILLISGPLFDAEMAAEPACEETQ